jgi:hypothetical protein
LRAKDGTAVGATFKVKPAQHGDEVEGRPTFDLCGRRFNSEKDRVARYRVNALTGGGAATGGGDEVVAYSSEAAAVVALQELRSVVRRCTLEVALRDGLYAEELRYQAVEQKKLKLPASDNVSVLLTVQRAGVDHVSCVLMIVQRHGAVLDILFGRAPSKFEPEQVDNLVELAGRTGRRLVNPAGAG